MGTVFSEAYIAQVLTRSQDDHDEIRLLITSYMVHHSMIQLLNLHAFWTQMKQWKISEANENAVLNLWATEMEVIAAAPMLSTTIYHPGPYSNG